MDVGEVGGQAERRVEWGFGSVSLGNEGLEVKVTG